MRVIIVGGGIGGLTLALMLHARGVGATVYEQSSEIREVGVGINTLPHAIRELADLGLLPVLDEAGIRTRELHYMNRFGQTVWSEPRGLHAGAPVPQFSIHRGRLQCVIRDAVVERLGEDAIRTGRRLQGFIQDEGGVTAHFSDTRFGEAGETARGDILVGADGIHSAVRGHYFPNQGPPRWQGVQMWRGACDWPVFLDGESMIIAGGMAGKLVLYPIGKGRTPQTRLTNWVVNIRTGDPEKPPPKEAWSKPGRLEDVLPFARRFSVPEVDILAMVRATSTFWEYPMCDRDPLPRWTHGRVTLLGDAAHPMYPVGSNGASQAVLDARCLADWLAKAEHPRQALAAYEAERLPATAEVVAMNRVGGPERVIDAVEALAPQGFEHIDQVLDHTAREQIVKGYAGKAGFSAEQLARKKG
ncbi:flavin-dependent oxidoreductase [Bosea robiniae]|uniref:2-polyprenyl-6-methoxyphenol hydroxylase n=1 Tax=Bosea robiniae TaxID=1036780 RepID=A0ABY0P9B3_9HYPH|nr:flavin-dependent oxidoreductase [Bosea robiniae]SDH74098.1 2-polyprenyl-6-methoxyphenol hydroxylase [Bosea robiniae]